MKKKAVIDTNDLGRTIARAALSEAAQAANLAMFIRQALSAKDADIINEVVSACADTINRSKRDESVRIKAAKSVISTFSRNAKAAGMTCRIGYRNDGERITLTIRTYDPTAYTPGRKSGGRQAVEGAAGKVTAGGALLANAPGAESYGLDSWAQAVINAIPSGHSVVDGLVAVIDKLTAVDRAALAKAIAAKAKADNKAAKTAAKKAGSKAA